MACGCQSRKAKTMSRQVSRRRTASSTSFTHNVIKSTSKRRIIRRPAR